MEHHRIKTITGTDLYLTFLSKKSRDRSKLTLDFVRRHVKIIDSDDLWRLFNLIKKEESKLPDFVLAQTSLDFKNAMRTLSNESTKRRNSYDLYRN